MTPAEQAFLDAYIALCRWHRLALVPTYEFEVSFHDPMKIVELDKQTEKFTLENTLGENE